MCAGKAYDIHPAAPSTIRRIEAGLLSYGADVNEKDTPYHINLGHLVNLDTTPNFLGKSALAALHGRGINRRLCGVEIEGAPLVLPLVRWWNAYDFADEKRQVGKIRSAVYSPALQKNIGFAMLDLPYDQIGSKLTVQTEYGDMRQAIVCPLPFIKHRTG